MYSSSIYRFLIRTFKFLCRQRGDGAPAGDQDDNEDDRLEPREQLQTALQKLKGYLKSGDYADLLASRSRVRGNYYTHSDDVSSADSNKRLLLDDLGVEQQEQEGLEQLGGEAEQLKDLLLGDGTYSMEDPSTEEGRETDYTQLRGVFKGDYTDYGDGRDTDRLSYQ